MKHGKSIFLILLFIGILSTGCAQTKENNSTSANEKNDKIQVYYFHYSRRCATCNAVEEESKKAVESLFGEKVSFLSLNLDEDESSQIANVLEVSGQSLLIVRGDTKLDITNEAFLNARSNPEKLRKTIQTKINELM